jgi:hypothetical protein
LKNALSGGNLILTEVLYWRILGFGRLTTVARG